jgi:crotonobetainyl-CoA:carnitine CoA-transferase CaiB-like acyl-CoA transferase
MGIAFADIFADLYGVIGVQATLAEHNTSGTRQQIDISLLDCTTGALANQAMSFLASGIRYSGLGIPISFSRSKCH